MTSFGTSAKAGSAPSTRSDIARRKQVDAQLGDVEPARHQRLDAGRRGVVAERHRHPRVPSELQLPDRESHRAHHTELTPRRGSPT